jgi:hypothetical protein
MRTIIIFSAAALAVLAVVLAGVLAQGPQLSRTAPIHATLLPAHPSAAPRPVILRAGPSHNLEPAQPVYPSPSGCCR